MTAPPEVPRESRGKMLKGALILVAARLGTAVLGVVQLLLIARYFGSTSAADAFFVASAVPLIFLGVVESNLGLTFTPLFVEMEEKGEESAAWTLAATLFKWGCALVTLYVLLTLALAGPLAHVLAPGFSAEKHAELTTLIRYLAPQALLVFVSGVLSTLCFIRGAFLLPAVASVVAAGLPCLCMVLLHERLQIRALPLGLVAGAVLGGAMLLAHFGPRHRLFRTPADARHPAVKTLGRMFLLRTAATSLMEVNATVDRMFASGLGQGHIAHLTYAARTLIAARRLFIVPVGRSLMPLLSRAAARQDHQEVRSLVVGSLRLLAVVVVPFFVLLVGFRHEVIALAFGRGAFDAEAAAFTARALLFYGFGALSAVVNPVLTATLFALRDSVSPLRVVSFGVVLNVLFNALFIRLFGFVGIPLAATAVATVVSVMLWRSLQRQTGALDVRHALSSLARTLLSAAALLAVARGAELGLRTYAAFPAWLDLMLAFGVGGVAYTIAQAALNPQEFRQARELVLRRRRARA